MTAQVTPRDLALLQEELKCLREKMSTLLSTAGGYTDVITSPGSSVYPDEYRENCGCVDIDVYEGNPQEMCQTNAGTEGTTGIGDFAENVYQPGSIRGLFMFDAINGVFYKSPDSNTWENRNTGLASDTLEHGCLDVWWYRKNTPSDDNAILWRCGVGTVQTTSNAGRIDWKNRSPEPPAGYTLGQITFIQIVSDPFVQNTFYLLATASGYRTWIVKTVDNGQSWTWLDLTAYNSVSSRFPIWMALSGNGANIIWVTTWGDGQLRVLKLNNGSSITISAEYDMGAASEWEVRNYFEVLSPATSPDSNSVWLYGRKSNPQGLGLSHVIRSDDNGSSWLIVENSWGLDWCGSMKLTLAQSGNRYLYAVRNPR